MQLKKNNEFSHLGKQDKWPVLCDIKYLLPVVLCQQYQRAVKHCLQKSFPFLLCADDDIFSSAFCEKSEKLINVHLFALAAKYYSLSNLGVCTPLEDVLEALKGDSEEATGIFTFVF